MPANCSYWRGDQGPADPPARTLSVLRAPSPRHLIQSHSFNSFNNCHLLLVLSVDIKKSLVVYLLELGCQFGKRLDCIISNCQANACLCVCMCVSHMSPFVSHQVGSHTQLAPHSSTELHTAPHGKSAYQGSTSSTPSDVRSHWMHWLHHTHA